MNNIDDILGQPLNVVSYKTTKDGCYMITVRLLSGIEYTVKVPQDSVTDIEQFMKVQRLEDHYMFIKFNTYYQLLLV